MRTKSKARGKASSGTRSTTSKKTQLASSRTRSGSQGSASRSGSENGSQGTASRSRTETGTQGTLGRVKNQAKSMLGLDQSNNERMERKSLRGKKSEESHDEGIFKFFEAQLQDMYWAEKYLLKAIPKMAEAAQNEELIDAFENHLEQTEEHVSRLEEVFELCDLKPTSKRCAAMEGLVEEGNQVISSFEEGPVRDAALIIAAQKVEHYEISTYGSLRALAELMQKDEVADLLQETLDEEGDTDHLLNELAEDINEEAYRTTYA
jgi:ferritin-like metal-binding protein YciE